MPETRCNLNRTRDGGFHCTACEARFSPGTPFFRTVKKWYGENVYLTDTDVQCRAVLLLELLKTAPTTRGMQDEVLKHAERERTTAFREAATQLEELAKETTNPEALALLQRAVWKMIEEQGKE